MKKRQSIRLRGYDYSQPGAYFVTICTYNRECILGDILKGKMTLNNYGKIVSETWQWLEANHPYVSLDEWVVMPNHLHSIIILHPPCQTDYTNSLCRGGSRTAHTSQTTNSAQIISRNENQLQLPEIKPIKIKPLGRLIGSFKTTSTKIINALRQNPGVPFWQRNFYERIIRNKIEMNKIREYIQKNPYEWMLDSDNPLNSCTPEQS